MASQALYRKWRSQTFNDLVGQQHVVQTLRNAITADRIGHAYLFTGPRGVGKTSAARILAKAVNCEHPEPAQRPCGECAACVAVADGRTVDVIEMDAASHTSVEDAREIIERVQFRPAVFRTKVYVIDEVHMLSTAAFNALLKTLEEPPDHAMFILATTELHKVPATITSRCQRFVFNRHTISDTAEHLRWIAQQEGVQFEHGVAEAIARSATGSMRDAVSVLDQLIGYGDALIPLERVRSLLGATAAEEVAELIQTLVAEDVAAALQVINTVTNQGADLRQFTRDVVSYLRGLMLLKAEGDPELLDVDPDALAVMREVAATIELRALLGWLKIFSGLDHQLRTSPYGQLPLEMAVVEALVVPAATAQAVPAVRTVQRTATAATATSTPQRQAQPKLATTPATAAAALPPQQDDQPEQPQPQATPQVVERSTQPVAATVEQPVEQHKEAGLEEVSLTEIDSIWNDFIDYMKPFDPRVQAVLRSCDPIEIEAGVLVIGARTPFHHRQLEDIHKQRLIEQVLEKLLQKTIRVRCELVTQEQQNRARDARKEREQLMEDDTVRAARNIFDARIVGVQEQE